MKPISLLLLSLLLPALARADAPSALTLAEALARTAEQHPRLLAARAQLRASAALSEQASLRPNPVLGVTLENFAGTGTTRGVDALEGTVEISQTLERGDKRGKRSALAQGEFTTAERMRAVLLAETLTATADAYLAVVGAEQQRALADAPRQLARDTLAAVEDHARTGTGYPAEVARTRAALAQADAEVARRDHALALARAHLAAATFTATQPLPPLALRVQLPSTLPEVAPLLARLATHPRLALEQARVNERRAALDLEQARAVQDVSVAGGVRFLRETSDAAFVAGFSVPLPVRHRNQGAIRAARDTLDAAALTVSAVESELRAEFSAAWQELTAAHQAALALRRDALPATEEAAAAVRHAYAAGELPLLDVLDAQRALASLHRELLDLDLAYARALVRVDALTDPSFTATASLLVSP